VYLAAGRKAAAGGKKTFVFRGSLDLGRQEKMGRKNGINLTDGAAVEGELARLNGFINSRNEIRSSLTFRGQSKQLRRPEKN